MKKFLALVLALALCFGLCSVAWADGEVTPEETTKPTTDMSTVTIKKVYKLTNAGTTSPAETFTLTQVGNGKVTDGDAESAPALDTITGATFAEGAATVDGAEANITIALPTYTRVGVYEYTLKETVGTTGGVTYRTDDIRLVVTVIQGSDGKIRVAAVHTETSGGKTGSIENTYSAAGGTDGGLKISKTVTGAMGDHDKYFKVTVTLNGENGKKYANSYTVTGGSKIEDGTTDCASSTITVGTAKDFYIKDGETLTIQNVPYGVTYTVDEDDYTGAGYTATGEVTEAAEVDAAAETVSITNTKDGTIDTGVSLDSLPYALLLGAALVGLTAFFARKRRED